MAVLSFVSLGMPLLCSGQEAGLDKRLEFFEKDEISWDDLSMQDFYEQLVALKKENRALWNGAEGAPVNFLPATDEDTLAFERDKNGERVVVVMNLSQEDTSTIVKVGSSEGTYQDYFTDARLDLDSEQTFELQPWEYKVLVR